jgi:hypothetical protein
MNVFVVASEICRPESRYWTQPILLALFFVLRLA